MKVLIWFPSKDNPLIREFRGYVTRHVSSTTRWVQAYDPNTSLYQYVPITVCTFPDATPLDLFIWGLNESHSR